MNKYNFEHKFQPEGNIYLLLMLIFSVTFSSCVDVITFSPDSVNEGNIVIQGKLIKGNPSVISVEINSIGTLENTINTEPVNVEKIMLINDLEQSIKLISMAPGLYFSEIPANSAQFSVATGKSYQLSIITSEGDEIVSSVEPLLPVPEMDSIDFDIKERAVLDRFEHEVTVNYLDYNISTFLNTPMSQPPLLKWSFEGCAKVIELSPPEIIPPYPPADTCYIKEKLSIDRIVLFDARNSASDYLPKYSVLEETLNSRYVSGYYLTIYQEALSEGAYTYWNQVSQVTQRNGGFFETPAGEIQSNFTNISQPESTIYGYFYAVEQDTLRRYVSPAELNYPVHMCFEFRHRYFWSPAPCQDCLKWKNSSMTKPDYWIE